VAWLAALVAVLPLAAAGSGQSIASADPWATMRGCTRILERTTSCRTDHSFKLVVTSWCDGNTVPSLSEKQLHGRLQSWRKADARRLSCAVWTGQPGASDHVGERSALARLAASDATCDTFNHQLARATWLRARVADQPP
jgi:hypothetical protein